MQTRNDDQDRRISKGSICHYYIPLSTGSMVRIVVVVQRRIWPFAKVKKLEFGSWTWKARWVRLNSLTLAPTPKEPEESDLDSATSILAAANEELDRVFAEVDAAFRAVDEASDLIRKALKSSRRHMRRHSDRGRNTR